MGIEPPPVNGDFVTEGLFLAMPPCFPGISLPPSADEGRMHRLFLSDDKTMIFAATRGPRPHLLQFIPKGTFGYAVDLGVPGDANEITAMTSRSGAQTEEMLVACSAGDCVTLYHWPAALTGHGIQEWHVVRLNPSQALDLPVSLISGIIRRDETVFAWGSGNGFFLRWTGKTVTLENRIELPECSSLVALNHDSFLLTPDYKLLTIRWNERRVGPGEQLPHRGSAPVAVSTFPGGMVWSEEDGSVFEWKGSKVRFRGKIPLRPVHSICRLADGKVFASAGSDIAHWYVLEGDHAWGRDLGVPVSTLTARRYGLQFSHLLTGRDGEIYAAENDRGGHLWIYFPRFYTP